MERSGELRERGEEIRGRTKNYRVGGGLKVKRKRKKGGKKLKKKMNKRLSQSY